MDAALNLLRRLPPDGVRRTLEDILSLAPDLMDDLLDQVNQPLQCRTDESNELQHRNKDFLICDYNRDEDSYRSHHSNEYFPPVSDGIKPSSRLRQMEIEANAIFALYREQYYEGGKSSVYLWDTCEDETLSNDTGTGFAACFLIKKGKLRWLSSFKSEVESCWCFSFDCLN